MNFRKLRQDMIILQNTLAKMTQSRELALVKTSIQKSMMWTGTFMKFAKLGDNPYAKHDGNRKTVKDIEPLFDDTDKILVLTGNDIEMVDEMREFLAKLAQSVNEYINVNEGNPELTVTDSFAATVSVVEIFKNLTEARMWLGMELGRIRDNKNN